MIFRRVLALILIVAVGGIAPAQAAKKSAAEGPAYKGAIVVDALSGKVLFEDGADTLNPPASVTKLMTFLVIKERIQSGHLTLETPVEVTAADSKIGGTQVWLKQGEVFPVEELLYALMIQSANDAAYALARTAAGSVPAFVELMNAKARELGMNHTTFRSPHGLPPSSRKLSDSDITTPRDLALLSRELLLKTDILKYTSVKVRPFRQGSPAEIMMRNHNHLLGKVAGVDGLKTGYTGGAGFCLAATAERQGRRVIVVVMGSPNFKTRDLHVGELIERGFAALPPPAPGTVTPAPTPVSKPVASSGGSAPSPISAAQPSAPAPAVGADAADLPRVTFPPLRK